MNSLFIFRRDFRITDNIGFNKCYKNSDKIYPIFIFTPEQIKQNAYKSNNAVQLNYCKPIIHEGYDLHLTESRHPVIERNLPPGEPYISNDIFVDNTTQQIIILTGPNMSGKSAILRQTALITLLAHMGSYVPATAAKISLTDKIFRRGGASDNLSGGVSTFMVEMNETANILNNLAVTQSETEKTLAYFKDHTITHSSVANFIKQLRK